MRISLLQENLLRAITTVGRAVSSTPQLPVLGNIFIKAEKQRVTFIGTNLETSIFFQVPAKVEKVGEISVSAKVFGEFISSLAAEKVSLEERGGKLAIAYQHGKATFSTLPTKDFPVREKPALKKEGALNFSPGQLLADIRKVVFAAAVDETRPVLAGVLLGEEKGKLRLVATDGYRLSLVISGEGGRGKLPSLIVPASALRELERGLKGEGPVQVFFDEAGKQVYFVQEGMILGSRLIEGEFPDYARIIPEKTKTRVEVEKETLVQAVRAAATFARESANIVKVAISPKQVSLSASAAQTGEGEFQLPDAKISGQPTEMAFNYRFLLEALSAFDGERIALEASGSLAPAKFTDPEKPNFLHIIMPVRLQG